MSLGWKESDLRGRLEEDKIDTLVFNLSSLAIVSASPAAPPFANIDEIVDYFSFDIVFMTLSAMAIWSSLGMFRGLTYFGKGMLSLNEFLLDLLNYYLALV